MTFGLAGGNVGVGEWLAIAERKITDIGGSARIETRMKEVLTYQHR
jgi:hypothetical protein